MEHEIGFVCHIAKYIAYMVIFLSKLIPQIQNGSEAIKMSH